MLDEMLLAIQSVLEELSSNLLTVLAYPLLPAQRIYWLYIISAVLLSFYVYCKTRQAQKTGFILFLFPEKIWKTTSAWLDVRYFFFHQIFRLSIYGTFLIAVSGYLFNAVSGSSSLIGNHNMGGAHKYV